MEKKRSKKTLVIWGIVLAVILVLSMPAIYTQCLDTAIRHDNVGAVKFILVFPGNLNRSNDFIDSVGRLPLQRACLEGNPEIVRMLIDKGADIEPAGRAEPIFVACESRSLQKLEVVKILVEAGADVNVLEGGSTPLTWIFKNLVFDSPEEKEQKQTADFETMKYLIEHGAKLDSEHTKDHILSNAAGVGNLQAVEYLIMTDELDINAVPYWGDTALMEAAREGHFDITEYLLEHGADTTIENSDGETAIDLAREKGHEDIVRLIENYEK